MTTSRSLTPKQLIAAAARALEARKDEVNKLNVFPVPDGDTGTNMALTMASVVSEVNTLPEDAALATVCHAVTQGSLMGARGNSGVILSQMLRGLCEVIASSSKLDPKTLADAFESAVKVAFQAVRKPVEGTMLTVLRDTSDAVRQAQEDGCDLDTALTVLAEASKESVRRTPDLLPVLKDAGVVDAGGFGLAIITEGLVAALEGHDVQDFDVTVEGGMAMAIEPVNDWDDDEYLYCTEFLLMGEGLDRGKIEEWISAAGGSELVAGEGDVLKIHVHTDDPGDVIARATSMGEVAQVHVNNMREQTEERREGLGIGTAVESEKPLGLVAVSAGKGMSDILRSLGVDEIVEGGQTMNPSTAQIIEAINRVPAEAVIVFPNNKNIIMAAQQAQEVAGRPVGLVPTRSAPEAFAALLMFDPEGDLAENVQEMSEIAATVRVGEITTAVKDSTGTKAGDISTGQIIGIHAGEIEIVGTDVADVALELLALIVDSAETLTLLAGEDFADEQVEALTQRFQEAYPDLEIDSLRGDQPLYPVIMAVE